MSAPNPTEEQSTVESTAGQTVTAFLTAFSSADAAAAMSVVAENASVTIHPIALHDGTAKDLRAFLDETIHAFPDLRVTVQDVIETGSVVTAEIKVEGTQAADYLGAINQEKHLDVDQAWRFQVDGDRISALGVYWCQNQLFRRLAVKRLDHVSLV